MQVAGEHLAILGFRRLPVQIPTPTPNLKAASKRRFLGTGRPARWRRPGPPGSKSRLPKNHLQSYVQTFGYLNKTI